ncbi:unnamed protein product [Blepharisma stoltei]|uniref:Uncharacterized protein n=1 Tax=Blepharisma stoltei TaxID=1481888 RepID=A0AAU9IRM8_9CILI|nr:unnamed protein product [Blepharisma stoltei]
MNLVRALPPHPTLIRSPRDRRVDLITNQYSFHILPPFKIYIYSLEFFPDVDLNNKSLMRRIVRDSRSTINLFLHKFIHCGMCFFSLNNLEMPPELSPDPALYDFCQNILTVNSIINEKEYGIRIQKAGTIDFKDFGTMNEATLMFFNLLLKEKLKSLGLIQLGNDRHLYDPNNTKTLQRYPVTVWPGYFASVNIARSGLQITLDCAFKLVREDNVLDVIQEISKKQNNNPREIIKNTLNGSLIVTSYGNQALYRIIDVLFEESPASTFPKGNDEISYTDYFCTRYQIDIKVRNQPLLLAKISKNAVPVKLIPELCKLAGADSLDSSPQFRKELALTTTLRPDQRKSKIQSIADRLEALPPDDWKIQYSRQPIITRGLMLEKPIIRLGEGTVRVNDNGSFKLTNKILRNAASIEKWMLFYPERDVEVAKSLTAGLREASHGCGILINNPLAIPITGKLTEENLVNSLFTNVKPNAQLIVTLIPRSFTKLYEKIKVLLTKERPIPSQVVLIETAKRDDYSIYSKILTQMATKIGSGQWSIAVPRNIPPLTMVVGIDVCHDTSLTKIGSVLGFSSSVDANFTKYYNRIAFHDGIQEISTVLAPIFRDALKEFYKYNKKQKPECIILYRDGVGISQYSQVVNIEIPQLVNSIRDFDRNWSPSIMAVIVNKRINQRFFLENNGVLSNPSPGVVIEDEVVVPHYNFYMISHSVTAGTVTPTHYNVIVNDSQVPCKALYELTYGLCHTYYNWQGAIRVPAPCMFAHKIAYLVGKYTKADFDTKLALTFFYL